MPEDPTIERKPKKPHLWAAKFWKEHGERFVFMTLATGFAGLFWVMDMKGEAKTILVGTAMLCYNKARTGKIKDEIDEPFN